MGGKLERFLDRVNGSSKISPRILEVLTYFETQGVAEVSDLKIKKRIEEVHPPRNFLEHSTKGTVALSLCDLVERGDISVRRVPNPPGAYESAAYLYRRTVLDEPRII